MKNKIGLLLFISFVAIVFYMSNKSSSDYKTIRTNGKTVTCSVVTLGSDVICNFEIDNIKHKKRISEPHKDIISGEMFIVYYYEKIPDKYFISFSEPVFDKSDYKITKPIDYEIGVGNLWFTYSVNGRSYKRFQAIDSYNLEKFNTKSESNDLTVYINKSNSKQAYLIY